MCSRLWTNPSGHWFIIGTGMGYGICSYFNRVQPWVRPVGSSGCSFGAQPTKLGGQVVIRDRAIMLPLFSSFISASPGEQPSHSHAKDCSCPSGDICVLCCQHVYPSYHHGTQIGHCDSGPASPGGDHSGRRSHQNHHPSEEPHLCPRRQCSGE